MYNSKHKREYLKIINDNKVQVNQLLTLFRNGYEYEKKYGKDLYDFDKEQLSELFESLGFSGATLAAMKTTLSKYIDYYVDKGIARKNSLKEITIKELLELGREVPYDSYDYNLIYDLVTFNRNKVSNNKYLYHVQDRLIVYLIFLGVRGKDMDLLKKLKYEHVDYDKKIIKVSEIDSRRKDIDVDELCIEMIKESRSNLQYKRSIKSEQYHSLENSDFVIKRISRGVVSTDEPINSAIIRNRLKDIQEITGIDYLTADYIEKCGKLFFGHLIKDRIEKGYSDAAVLKEPLVNMLFDRYDIDDEQSKYRLLWDIRDNEL